MSREGRRYLQLICVMMLLVGLALAFIIRGQEQQGQLLNDLNQKVDNIQITSDITMGVITTDKLIGDFTATAYCAGFEPCAICGTDGITATGTKCSPMGNDFVTIAVDPRVIPYGTKLVIVEPDGNLIYGIAEDTGGFADKTLYGTFQIDICFANHEEAIQYGTKEVTIYSFL